MVDAAHIEEALAVQKERGGRLGEVLVELGHVSEVQLAQVLSNQLSIPWVNLYHVDFSRELLNLIPAEVAEKYGCVPVYIRKVRATGETLFVATDDPTNEQALTTIATHAAMPVKPMVASSSDVRNAIRVYYFAGKPLASEVAKPKPAPARKASIPPVELEPEELESEAPVPLVIPKTAAVPVVEAAPAAPEPAPPEPAPPEPQPRSAEALAPTAVAEASPEPVAAPVAKKKKPRMITLTLLDGSTVRLPAPGEKKATEEAPEEGLTTRDLIAALLARAEGKDVSSVLADARWEPLMAALLSLLLKKGLIADWEFVEEWRKHRR